MYMKLKDGKSKVVTLSYDDGFVYDMKMVEILDRYGLKCTFNLNSGKYFPEDEERERFKGKMKLSECQALYINSGHEVACHALTHPFLERLKMPEVLEEILADRKNLEDQFGTIIRGMAYPYGTYSDSVVKALRMSGIAYARTTKATQKYHFPEDWLELHPTCHHTDPNFMELAKDFVENQPDHNYYINCMFYVWGHSWEFNRHKNWELLEEFGEYIGGREDIWYATNIEIYDYVKAYESLQVSVDKKIIHNPSAIDIWFEEKKETYCVKAGQTLYL